MCRPFVSKIISQKSMRLRLFLFSMTDETSKWLLELPNDSITLWEELTGTLLEIFFPPLKMGNIEPKSKISNALEVKL